MQAKTVPRLLISLRIGTVTRVMTLNTTLCMELWCGTVQSGTILRRFQKSLQPESPQQKMETIYYKPQIIKKTGASAWKNYNKLMVNLRAVRE
jgi:hypothetical protein